MRHRNAPRLGIGFAALVVSARDGRPDVPRVGDGREITAARVHRHAGGRCEPAGCARRDAE